VGLLNLRLEQDIHTGKLRAIKELAKVEDIDWQSIIFYMIKKAWRTTQKKTGKTHALGRQYFTTNTLAWDEP